MTHTVLDLWIKLGSSFPQLGNIKIGIIAEPVVTSSLLGDFTMPGALRNDRTRIIFGAHENQHRNVGSTTVFMILQLQQKAAVVGRIGFFLAEQRGISRR